ncbi:MAG: hypothetical protein JRE40_04035 [Deltaproteobacteria bacterium]|nr:hypothetical protein [Deltaproteobacteria bacterium]
MVKQALTKAPPIVAFRVPNTKAGRHWIDRARTYVNRERFGQVLARPRGGTRGKYAHSCQSHDAKAWGIYLRERPEVEAFERAARGAGLVTSWLHNDAIEALQRNHSTLLENKNQTIRALKRDCIDAGAARDLAETGRRRAIHFGIASVVFTSCAAFVMGLAL